MLHACLQDARFAIRLLRRSPLFTITAALSLAIGIGANTTIFSVANALLMRPLPGIADPSRVVDLGRTTRGSGFDTISHHYYRMVRERATTLSSVYAINLEPLPISLGGRAEPERVYGTLVSGSYFPTLGTQPALGRLLTDADDVTPGGHPVTVISHRLWQRRFDSNPAIVGQTVTLNSQAFTIVGVAPPGFQGTTILEPDLWMTLSMVSQAAPRRSLGLLTERAWVWLVMGGRLKDGTTLAQAQAEMNAIAANLQREYPQEYGERGISVMTSALVPGRIGYVAAFLGLLMTIVGLVLLIACVNLAGMMLARSVNRRREIAVRLAIGADRGRLIRQLMTETVVIFSAGGIAGFALSQWLTAMLLSLLPTLPAPISVAVTTDWRVVGFSILLCLVAALISGLAPALQTARADLVPSLKIEGMDSGPSRLRLRNAFVVGQITMSLLLVIVAGLFFRALQHATSVQPGFDQERVDVVSLDFSVAGVKENAEAAFARELLTKVRALPGVEAATTAWDLPLDGGRMGLGALQLPGSEDTLDADWNVVETDYFKALNIRLTRGRDFSTGDTSSSPRVAIVNGALARRLWPDQDPIGRRVRARNPDGGFELTVVGVADDVKMVSLGGDVEPFVYVPMSQQPMSRIWLVVRTASTPSAIPQLRALLREATPNLPITEALPLSEVTAIGLIPQRVAAAVAGSLGLVGLVLAAIGIYGVTAYAVGRRTREIGIRMALGADRRRVLSLVLRQGLVLAAIGVSLGVILAALGSSLLESLLIGISGLDVVTFATACALFAAVTLVASYLPARRAARVDPMVALRHE
jgi:predicted permease